MSTPGCTCPAGSYDFPNAVHEDYCALTRVQMAEAAAEKNCELYRQASTRLAEIGLAATRLIETWDRSADSLGPEWIGMGERVQELNHVLRGSAARTEEQG
jgi:hypothetical protein